MTSSENNAKLSEALGTFDSHSRWKPITSAPRDGTWFIARTAYGTKRVVHYADEDDNYPVSHDGVCWSTEPVEWTPLAAVLEEMSDLEIRTKNQSRTIGEYEKFDGMDGAVVHAIREVLNAHNVPVSAFVDDHVMNAIYQRDAFEAEAMRYKKVLETVLEYTGSHLIHAIARKALNGDVKKMNLNKNGDLIGTPLEMKLRMAWREVAKHHKVNNDGVLEADLVRAFLVIHDEIVSKLSDETPEPKSEVIEFTFGGNGGTARGSTLIENLPGDVFEVEVGKYASVCNGKGPDDELSSSLEERIDTLVDVVYELTDTVKTKFEGSDGNWGNPPFSSAIRKIQRQLLNIYRAKNEKTCRS